MRFRTTFSVFFALTAFGGGAAAPAHAEGFSLKPAPSAILVAPADAGQQAEPKRPTEEELSPPDEPETTTPPEAPRADDGAAKSAAPRKERIEYTVATGDTLGGIAYRHGVSVSALVAANGLGREATLQVGQKLLIPPPSETIRTPAQTHVVASGNTLASIARRYGVTVEALLEANHMHRTERLRIGQKLTIPGAGVPRPRTEDDSPAPASESGGMQRLSVAGSGPAYYYEPTGPGRLHMRPVIMYLHGRGADPAAYCRRWARVARNLGWVVCPSGPEDRGEGKRGWNNNWPEGHGVVMRTIQALRTKYGRRVQLYGNTLIGFSEGAYVAMNVGLREPKTFNRWLILGADTDYWGSSGFATLPEAKGRVRKVYLITGQHDDVVDDAAEVKKWLVHAGVPVRMSTPRDMGHEVALEAKPSMYQAALRWLAEG